MLETCRCLVQGNGLGPAAMIIVSTQCFPPDLGGIEILMGGIAGRLHQSGAQIMVLADAIRSDRTELSFPYAIKRFGGLKPIRRWLKGRAVRQLAKEHKATALIADSWKSLEQIGKLDLTTLVLAHGNELQEAPNSAKGMRIKKALNRADLIVANSRFTAHLVEKFNIERSKICVFLPPIEPQPDASPEALKKLDVRLGERGPLLATVARLEPRKGIDDVIKALPKLIGTYPDLVYAVAGGGDDLIRLETLAKELGVEGHIVFLGRVNEQERAALLARATLFVMPTREVGRSVEGFGISYIEAGWYGVPCIASRVGGTVDAVVDGETGLCIDGGKEGDLTRAIERLLADGTLRKKMGKAATQRAHHELCWDHAVDTFRGLIEVARERHRQSGGPRA